MVEHDRVYHYGLFRVPHIGAALLTFIMLVFFYQWQRMHSYLWAAGFAILFAIVLWSRVRTFPVAILLSLVLWQLIKKRYWIFGGIILAAIMAIIFRFQLYEATKANILSQYTGILITITDNFTSLSRFLIWKFWFWEISGFQWQEWLYGRSYIASHLANLKNIGFRLWFHNDFLSIIYAYGIPAAVFYTGFLINIFRDHRKQILSNCYIFLFYSTFILSAFINGLYKYFPVFILFMFLYLVSSERKKQQSIPVM